MKKLIFFVLVIACLISPVMGETIDYDYSTSSTSYTTMLHNDIYAYSNIHYFYTDDICYYSSITSIRSSFPVSENLAEDDYYEAEFTLSIGSDVVGYGTYSLSSNRFLGVRTGNVVMTLLFDDYDVSGYSGAQTFILSIDGDTDLPKAGAQRWTGHRTPDVNFFTLGVIIGDVPIYQKTSVYQSIDFHQEIDYTYIDNTLDLSMVKNGYNNGVSIISDDGYILYQSSNEDDFAIISPNINSAEVTVTNPYQDDDWVNIIPETSTSTDLPDPAEFTAYIYDAQTGNLISWSCLNKTYSGEYALPSSTYDPDGVIQAVAYWDETDWALFTASATGYKPDTTEFNYTAATAPPGSSTQMIFHLVPDGSIGNGSYALSFKVSQEISPTSELWTRSVDATVICDGEQHLTGPTGTTWFNVSAGDHPYTVAKNGFETVQGTVTVSGNMLQSVYLNLGPDTPTVDDPTGNESGEVGDEDMHTAVAEAYAQFGAFIPEAVMIACVLFLLSMFKKF